MRYRRYSDSDLAPAPARKSPLVVPGGLQELGRRILPRNEVEALQSALQAAGVEFANGKELSVNLRKAAKA